MPPVYCTCMWNTVGWKQSIGIPCQMYVQCIELTMLNVSKINMYYSSAEDSENSEAEDNVDCLNVHGIFCLICKFIKTKMFG